MKIIVTGGAGFIGSHVVDAYVEEGHEVLVIDDLSNGKEANVNAKARLEVVDIRDAKVPELFRAFQPDVVNHHAAQASVSVSVREPKLDADVNVMGSLNLLQAARDVACKRFVFAASGGTAYGETDRIPCTEDLPVAPISPYGIAKAAFERYLVFARRELPMETVTLRYANIYGPRQDPHGEAGVVAIFFELMGKGERPTIFGTGEFTRDYTYVGDVARANVLALSKGDGLAINIGTAVQTSVTELYRLMAAAVGFEGAPIHGPDRPGDLEHSALAWGLAKEVLGFEPTVTLAQGLARTWDHFRRQA